MKNLLFLAVAVFGLLWSCNKNRDQDQNPNILPAATQSGANTGGALVEGNIFVAKIENPAANNTQYEFVNGQYKLEIHLRSNDDPSGKLISVFVVSDLDFKIGDYELNDDVINRGIYFNSPDGYITDINNTGILSITKFDKINKIVSGTFSFKAKNSNGKIINITEGRFDKKFIY